MWASGRSTRVDVDAGCQDIKSISYLDAFIPKPMLWAYWPDTGTVSTQPNFSHERISGMDRIQQILCTHVCEVMCNNTARFVYRVLSLNVESIQNVLMWFALKKHITMAMLFVWRLILWFQQEKHKLHRMKFWHCGFPAADSYHHNTTLPIWVKQICCSALPLPAQNRHWSPFSTALPCSS